MKTLFCLLLLGMTCGCGTDKEALMETKLGSSLRQEVAKLEKEGERRLLDIFGKCTAMIDAEMRGQLLTAGAHIESMNKEIFTGRISSDSVLTVAGLDFVVQLQLSHESNPLPK